MFTLHYHSTSGPARAVRLLLQEKAIPHVLKQEPYWERNPALAALNPECTLPILEGDIVVAGIDAVMHYIEETHPEPLFFGDTAREKAEIRRLTSWFTHKFSFEVSNYIIEERLIRYFNREGAPRAEIIRAATANLKTHLEYITFLLQHQRLLAGDQLSMADIMAAAQLSVIDYLGDVPWQQFPQAKEWYLLMKSRPSFKPLLQESITGFSPAAHYNVLDF